MGELTEMLTSYNSDDEKSAEKLLHVVYEELRRLAVAKMAKEKPGQTLQPTALVHEAYLRLVGAADWNGRGHFFGAAAEAMRRILVEKARQKKSLKRGGTFQNAGYDVDELKETSGEIDQLDLLALDEALDRLAAHDIKKAELVKLRFFAGLTVEDAAETLGISVATAKRYWVYSRAWLYGELNNDTPA